MFRPEYSRRYTRRKHCHLDQNTPTKKVRLARSSLVSLRRLPSTGHNAQQYRGCSALFCNISSAHCTGYVTVHVMYAIGLLEKCSGLHCSLHSSMQVAYRDSKSDSPAVSIILGN